MNEDKKNYSYMVGRVFGTILIGCIAAIAIACTVKVIMWIL